MSIEMKLEPANRGRRRRYTAGQMRALLDVAVAGPVNWIARVAGPPAVVSARRRSVDRRSSGATDGDGARTRAR